MIRNILRRLINRNMPPIPVTGAADARWSVISTAHDLYVQPNDSLVAIALRAAEEARTLRLDALEARSADPDLSWIRTWPGEHYRLLAGLTRTLDAKNIVEVGTFKGQGALALAAGADHATVVTYDVMPWDGFSETALVLADFDGGRIEQRIGDLGDATYRATQVDTLRAADVVFIDGPKDGEWEDHAVPDILAHLTDRRRLVVFDDIRLLPMVQLWRDLPFPKLDVTSLGHWSGTGFLWTA